MGCPWNGGWTVLGLLALFGLFAGLVVLVVFFKIIFAIVVWPFRLLFWILGGLFSLLLLPFQLLGVAMLGLLLLPMLILGLPLLLVVGIPVIVIAAIALPLILVGGGLLLVGKLLFSH